MKIRKHRFYFFILLFAASSLLFQLPPEAFAATSDGTVDSTVEINDSTTNGPELANGYWFGGSVANIGDLDGDGVNDLAVGANLDSGAGTKEGAVHIMFMNTDGSVDSTVDIDSDTTNGPTLTSNDRFGSSVTEIGDLDGDGVNDLAVGARLDDIKSDGSDGGANWNAGAVHILFMNTDGSVDSTVEINDSTTNGPALSEADTFGTSVANIGDLDGDGVNDLAVGARLDDGGGTDRGAVHILFMNTDGSVDSTVEINDSTTNGPTLTNNDHFGDSVANIGDLDGDGVNDLAVGAIYDDAGGTDRGAVHILFMNTDGSVDSTVEINDSTTNGPELGDEDRFGDSVANIGDLDGDGVNDLAVGAPNDDTKSDGSDGGRNWDAGGAYIIFMNTDGSVDSTVEINDSTTNGPALSGADSFGHGVANIGDLDGNGVNDIVVGAMLDDGIGSNRGAVHIMFMHETTKPTVTITSSSGDSDSTVSSDTLSYTATFSESVTGFVVGDITVTGTANGGSPEASNFAGSGTTYTFDVVQGTSDGTVLVSVAAGKATDASGNDNTVSNTYTFTIDTSVAASDTSDTSTASTGGTCSRHVILGNCGTIAINNDEYRIINTWTNVPTTEVLVGQPVTVTLSTPNNPTHTKIHFASVHTEVFSIPANFDQTAHIDYSPVSNQVTYISQSQLFQVAGATHRISHDPDVRNLEMFEVVFTMIFAKPMDTSHVVVETKNKHGIPETLYLLDALKVNENLAQALTLEEKSKFSIIDPEPEMDPEPEIEMDPEPEQTKKEKSKRQRR